MMCTVCYTIWFPILACQSSWHYTFTTRQCFQDCLLRLHIRYSEGRQNPNIAPNSTQEVKEIQIMAKIKYSDGRQTKYCSKQHSEGRNPNIAPNSTQRMKEIQILPLIVLRGKTHQILLEKNLRGQKRSKYCPKQYSDTESRIQILAKHLCQSPSLKMNAY